MYARKICVVLIMLIVVPFLTYGEQVGDYFPIKPGTKEWRAFTSHTQKTEALQLPKSELERMSTAQLLQVCLSYPMASEIMLHDNSQKGIEAIISQFNGLQELVKRKDAALILLNFYSKINPIRLDDTWPLEKKGEFAFNIRYVELLLAQDAMLSKLSISDRRLLLTEALQKFDAKVKNPEIFGLVSLSTPTLLMARILEKDNRRSYRRAVGEDENLDLFIEKMRLADVSLLDKLVLESREYLGK